ncbi:transposase family protein [Caldilinea sp.]|uniref:transposase family protein n=1 Tax=Caldilinea sp. TaxID=2293560 RepID=UPI00261BE29F|nr:transposase family protein [Caldilinea sp.]
MRYSQNVHDTAFHPLLRSFEEEMFLLVDPGFYSKTENPANMKVCKRISWNVRMMAETVLSMLTTGRHFKRSAIGFGSISRLAWRLPWRRSICWFSGMACIPTRTALFAFPLLSSVYDVASLVTNYSTLAEALAHISDSRSARGQSYEWQFLLILIGAALMSGKKSMLEINNWVQMHGEELKTTLKPKKGRIPSLATLQRVVRDVEITTLEATLSKFQRGLSHETGDVGAVVTQDGRKLHGLALDGKTVRGASAYGETVHSVSLVHHSSGLVFDQDKTCEKLHERCVAEKILAHND